MAHQIERRLNAMEVSSDSPSLYGLAARYNSLSHDLGGFRERILPGAFRNVISQDVRCLVNHDASLILGRTKSGTLELKDLPAGLYFDVDLPDTGTGRDIRELVKRGDISQCSFGFVVGDGNDDFNMEEDEEGNSFICRTIRSFQTLLDVSAVTYPAYEDTNVSASRSVVPEAVQLRARDFAKRHVVVPSLGPKRYVRLTDAQIAEAIEEEKGIKGRSVGMTDGPLERFIKEEKKRDHVRNVSDPDSEDYDPDDPDFDPNWSERKRK